MPFPFTIDLGENGGAFRFKDLAQMQVFVDREWDEWVWFGQAAMNANNRAGRSQQIVNLWNRFSAEISNMRQQFAQGSDDAAQGIFTAWFTNVDSVPVSTSSFGKLILQAKEEIDLDGGLGALAVVQGLRFDSDDPSQFRGAMLAHELLYGTGKAARQSVQEGLTSLIRRMSAQQIKAEDQAILLDGKIDDLDRRRKHQLKRIVNAGGKARRKLAEQIDADLEALRQQTNLHHETVQAQATNAITSIQNTEKTYSEQMGLEAPVTYWRKKAKAHTWKSRIAGVIGLIFAGIMSWLGISQGVAWVINLVKTVFDATHQWQATYSVLGVAVFVVTVVFWIGRLISRTYISESHLAIDAEERAVMVETYLALTQANKIQTSERILVLGSLFRASSDGLVRDDGGPDAAGLAGILSKVGVPNPAAATGAPK